MRGAGSPAMAMADPQRKRRGAGGDAADAPGVQADAEPGLDLLAGDFGKTLSRAEMVRGYARYLRLIGRDVDADADKTAAGGSRAAGRDAGAEAFDGGVDERIAALMDKDIDDYINEGIKERTNESIKEGIDEDFNVHLPRILALAWASYGFTSQHHGF